MGKHFSPGFGAPYHPVSNAVLVGIPFPTGVFWPTLELSEKAGDGRCSDAWHQDHIGNEMLICNRDQ